MGEPGAFLNGERASPLARTLSVSIVGLLWLATTYLFWVGYVGTDDLVYSRYAAQFSRPPQNWLEFRIPAILAIRTSFLAFGESEFAATLPSLLASITILLSAAWFTRWPKRLTWQNQTTVLFLVTLGYDVAFRSTPGATYLAAAFLALGTVCMLENNRWTPYLGAALFALGFSTHETSVFYIGIFCLVALLLNRRKYSYPVLATIAFSALSVAIEGVVYHFILGDAMARFKSAGSTVAALPFALDPDTGLSGLPFFLWPLKTLLISKVFGIDLALLFLTGASVWKYFSEAERILFVATVLTWFWLGYGTQAPWTYRPLYRQMHYYGPLVLGIGTLLPVALYQLLRMHRVWLYGVATSLIALNLGLSAAGGRWGQEVTVSKQLLAYAASHSGQTFVTDLKTMNEMYAIGGFHLPKNVVCLNSPAARNFLGLIAVSMDQHPQFPVEPVDGILVNLQIFPSVEPEFAELIHLQERNGQPVITIVPASYKPLYEPWISVLKPEEFMIRSRGAKLVAMKKAVP